MHRAQITYDWVDGCTGEARRGQVAPAYREAVREWLAGLPCGGGDFALEGCTGWRYVTEELVRAGYVAHVAEPAETADRRGSKRRAKTDKTDAKHLRELHCNRRGHPRMRATHRVLRRVKSPRKPRVRPFPAYTELAGTRGGD